MGHENGKTNVWKEHQNNNLMSFEPPGTKAIARLFESLKTPLKFLLIFMDLFMYFELVCNSSFSFLVLPMEALRSLLQATIHNFKKKEVSTAYIQLVATSLSREIKLSWKDILANEKKAGEEQ